MLQGIWWHYRPDKWSVYDRIVFYRVKSPGGREQRITNAAYSLAFFALEQQNGGEL